MKNTEDERVHLGSLFIITCMGGTIGSKGLHEVRELCLPGVPGHKQYTHTPDLKKLVCIFCIHTLEFQSSSVSFQLIVFKMVLFFQNICISKYIVSSR